MVAQPDVSKLILLTAIFLILIIVFSIRMSGKLIFKSNNPVYKEYFIWQYENKPHSLLLHSVTMRDTMFSAYSDKLDSIMYFPAQRNDIEFIENLMGSFSFRPQECANCHQENKTN